MEHKEITKYKFTSPCIRKILEINNELLNSYMINQFSIFTSIIEIPSQKYIKEHQVINLSITTNMLINILKMYKPFIYTSYYI